MATATTTTSPPTRYVGDKPLARDFRQEVTDTIVQMLEKGVAPWQKPWRCLAQHAAQPYIGAHLPWRQRGTSYGDGSAEWLWRSSVDDVQAGVRAGMASPSRREG